MMRALFSGVTGLRSHQTKMDVIGNNIANVNTVGYKKNAVTFKDLYNETISAAAASTGAGGGGTGGVNAKQIGLGATVDAIAAIHTPGSAQYTGNTMDVSISGDGYFAVMTPNGIQYTRAGNFYTDLTGNLVTADGNYVLTVSPIVSAREALTVDKVVTNNLINQGKGIRDAAWIGNVTADLTGVGDADFKIVYTPDTTEPWKVSYGAGTTKDYYPDTTSSPVKSGSLNVAAIAEEMKAQAALFGTAKAGTYDMKFENGVDDGGSPIINMKFGDMIVATAPAEAVPPGGAPKLFTFQTPGGTTIGVLTVVNETSTVYEPDQLADTVFNKMGQKPSLIFEEIGVWSLTKNGSPVETINMEYTPTAKGGISGDIMFTTAQYGTVLLKLDEGMIDNQEDLNDALNDGSFKIDVKTENVPEYTPPIAVTQDALKTLTVNFANYTSISIDNTGAVMGQLKHDTQMQIDGKTINMKAGDKVVLGYIGMATFNNPSGLEKVGSNLFMVSANSGQPTFGTPGDGTAGSLSPSNLEMSNVDLSEEMVNMIITQRGFQANSRIITTTDTMLEELVNLKR